jgi:hypothetical protein
MTENRIMTARRYGVSKAPRRYLAAGILFATLGLAGSGTGFAASGDDQTVVLPGALTMIGQNNVINILASQQRPLGRAASVAGNAAPAVRVVPRHPAPSALGYATLGRSTSVTGAPAIKDAPLALAAAPSFTGQAGITGAQQQGTTGGPDEEPANPNIAVGVNEIFQVTNGAFAAFDGSGNSLTGGPLSIAFLFGVDPSVVTLSNPRTIYDADINAFIVSETGIVANADGTQSGKIYFAVVGASDPSLSFTAYSIDASQAVAGAGAPYYADFVQTGTDANGLYFSGNLFSIAKGDYAGAVVYALSKSAIAAAPAAVPPVVELLLPGDYALAPTVTAPHSQPISANGGTEYFLEARGAVAAQLRVLALINTQSLNSATPALQISHADLTSFPYALPVSAQQPNQVGPYGQSVGATRAPELDAGLDIFTAPVVLSQGKLWGALATAVFDRNANLASGVAYFSIAPGATSVGQSRIASQGYLTAPVAGGSLLNPSIAMNANGKGAIGFTLTGSSTFPSAAFAPLTSAGSAGAVTISGLGAAAEDGFSGFAPNGSVARWGGNSGVAVDPTDGSTWLVSEYIPDAAVYPRDKNVNWGTFVTHYTP